MNESTLVPRKEMSDLDWLARNVHHWGSDHARTISYSTEFGGERYGDGLPYPKYTKAQWLARRAELQNKPSWDDHPDAKCFVQDGYGNWLKNTLTSCAEVISDFWRATPSDGFVFICAGTILGDWRDTLEKRPEQAKFEPFVSVDDAKVTIMQSEGDVKHFGGIIGRSLLLEEDAATAKQSAPKGSGNPILGIVLADLTNRALEGKEKYGEPLLAHNGRNALWDLYQELLDAAMYIRQAIEEQKQ